MNTLEKLPKLQMRPSNYRRNPVMNDRDLIILYNEGLPIQMIAEFYRCSSATVDRKLHRIVNAQNAADKVATA